MINPKLMACLALAAASAGSIAARTPQPGVGATDGYKLVWQDLFDAEYISPLRWNIEVNGNGGGNNELQYYTDREENVRLGDDGFGNRCLILTARRENYNGKAFTSGRVNSKKLTRFLHGKIEARIKFPSTANGLWPAFWMMGDDYDEVGWPRCGETDFVEMGHSDGFAGMQDRYFNGAMHWGQGWPQASYAKATAWGESIQDGEFHLVTVVWDEELMSMYLDLDKHPNWRPYYEMEIKATEPDNEWSPGNYFHKENFIIFNLAVGGNFPGIHNAADVTALTEANGNQASMMVDYVKIYQKGDTTENLVAEDPGDKIDSGISAVYAESTPRYYSLDGIPYEGVPTQPGFYVVCCGTKSKRVILP